MKETDRDQQQPPTAATAELAAFHGVSPFTVTRWRKDGLPCLSGGGRGHEARYSVPASITWRIAKERSRYGEPGVASLEIERAGLTRLQRERLEMQNRTRRGELVEASAVEASWARQIVEARTALLGLPTRAKQQLPHLPVADVLVLDRLVRQALEALADGRKDGAPA
jgi:phage terminase Nu1 subunit (DNA packaging protein)